MYNDEKSCPLTAEQAWQHGKTLAADASTPAEFFHAQSFLCIAADQEHAPAQHLLAQLLLAGKGRSPDPESARYWMEKSAGHGYAPAEAALSEMMYYGIGGQKNLQGAVYWLERAMQRPAEQQPDVPAHSLRRLALLRLELAAAYRDGDGADKDPDGSEKQIKQARWEMRTAADKGDMDANFHYGYMQEEGIGNSSNAACAAASYGIAACRMMRILQLANQELPVSEGAVDAAIKAEDPATARALAEKLGFRANPVLIGLTR